MQRTKATITFHSACLCLDLTTSQAPLGLLYNIYISLAWSMKHESAPVKSCSWIHAGALPQIRNTVKNHMIRSSLLTLSVSLSRTHIYTLSRRWEEIVENPTYCSCNCCCCWFSCSSLLNTNTEKQSNYSPLNKLLVLPLFFSHSYSLFMLLSYSIALLKMFAQNTVRRATAIFACCCLFWLIFHHSPNANFSNGNLLQQKPWFNLLHMYESKSNFNLFVMTWHALQRNYYYCELLRKII